jgi:hypothetical protein
MTPPQRILLLTSSEYGQSNVVLALAHELALRPNVQVHIASFAVLDKRVSQLQDSLQAAGSTFPVTFHPLSGLSVGEALARKLETVNNLTHAPGVKGAILSYTRLINIVAPWSGPEYIEVYERCMEIIKSVNPHTIVVEAILSQAVDACRTLLRKYMVISPNSFTELITQRQPALAFFWKYPM